VRHLYDECVPEGFSHLSQLYFTRTGFNETTFHVLIGYRRSYIGTNINVGSTFNGDVMYFGDGTQSPAMRMTVASINVADDWALATATVAHQYRLSVSTNFTAYMLMTARINSLNNNAALPMRVETVVDFLSNYSESPIVSGFPTLVCVLCFVFFFLLTRK